MQYDPPKSKSGKPMNLIRVSCGGVASISTVHVLADKEWRIIDITPRDWRGKYIVEK